MNSKEENSYDFCPNYVQEFGLGQERFSVRGLCVLCCIDKINKFTSCI